MNNIISEMLKNNDRLTINNRKNSIKEAVQEIVLCALSKSGFFSSAAFYGGSALRIFHGLERFSEDLDFSLEAPDPEFVLDPWLPALEQELISYGFKFKAERKNKTHDSAIQSAFIKGNTREHILICYTDKQMASAIAGSELIKIKFEVDTMPPPLARFENKFRLLPIPYAVRLYDEPSLFAGKLHAVICRAWKNRIKGRDLFDFVFYISRRTRVNLKHLNARLTDSGFEGARDDLSIDDIKQILLNRFETIDYDMAKTDVRPFITNPASLDVWCKEFFQALTASLTAE